MRILAVIPAYNEEECIEQTVRNLMLVAPEVDYVVINDGSSDSTSAICHRLGFPIIDMPVNVGLTAGFQTGMKYALRHGYDAVIQFDADGQHLPEYIQPMAKALQQGADVVCASRILAGQSLSGARMAGSRLLSWLIRVTTGTRITDPTSGMRMYNREMISMFARGFDLAPEPDFLAMACHHGRKVVEVPARMLERQGGESYLNLPKIISYMSRECLSILMFQWFR